MKIRVCLLLLLAVSSLVQANSPRPNVLFVAVDDLKPLLGSYGDTHAITPNLDALAATGVRFSRAYTQYPVCGPSRMSLLTGTRPEVNGVTNLKLKLRDVNPSFVTLPQLFRNNGYTTAASGKIFDPRNVSSRQQDDPLSWSIPYQAPQSELEKSRLAVERVNQPDAAFVDGDINQRAITLLKQLAAKDDPFFLAVGYKKPHLPFVAPARFFDRFDPEQFSLAEFQQAPVDGESKYLLHNNPELRGYHPSAQVNKGGKYSEQGITHAEQRELLHGYYAATSFIDALFGELVLALEQTGKAENTVIVVWGDHGFHLGDHGLWGKHTTMEQSAQVPLIIKLPGGEPRVVDQPVELMDLYKTLADVAGLAVPKVVQGKTLTGVLKGERLKDEEAVAVTQYKRAGAYGYSIRSERYRYTEWVNKHGKTVYRDLYDLQADPMETQNIIAIPDKQADVKRLARLLRQHGEGLMRLHIKN